MTGRLKWMAADATLFCESREQRNMKERATAGDGGEERQRERKEK